MVLGREDFIPTLENEELKLGVEGYASLSAGIGSDRMLNEHLQEITVEDGDSHLVEFSDALQSKFPNQRADERIATKILDRHGLLQEDGVFPVLHSSS